MPQSLFIFDFGANEEAVQGARHQLDSWRQAFRLGNKLKFKMERKAADQPAEGAPAAEEDGAEKLRLLVRLEFSEHEKLSYQRWFDRIPTEEPFKSAEKQILRRGQDGYDAAVESFDALK